MMSAVRIRLAGPSERSAMDSEEIANILSFLMRDGSAHLERGGVPIDLATVRTMSPEEYKGCDLVVFDDDLVRTVAALASPLE